MMPSPSRLALLASAPTFWWLYWLISLAASGFYASFSFQIHSSKELAKLAAYPRAWRVHQWWFNFVGSFSGWIALSLLIEKAGYCAAERCVPDLNLSDAVLALLAFAGVAGYVPYAAAGTLNAIGKVVRRATGDS